MGTLGKTDWYGSEKKIVLAVALAILAASVSVFVTLYWMMNGALLEDIRSRARVVNDYAQRHLAEGSFVHINGPEDVRRDSYMEMQATLDDIRQIANVRYLYTAKNNAEGRPVYLVDGLPMGSEDFRNPGDLIEPDIRPMLDSCLSGRFIESDQVLNTEWGAIFLTCTPVCTYGEAVPVGAVVMEFNADVVYASKIRAMIYSGALAAVIVTVCTLVTMVCLRRLATPFYKKLAYTDMLTGIGNRTAFELELGELERKLSHRIIIVLYDLNHMKRINDTWGHAAGDAYLKRMAHLLIRDAYRIGGDEFVTVFADEDRERLERELELFHMACTRVEVNGQPITFAYGVAEYDPSLDDGSLHATLSRADALMYRSKKAGRAPC